MCLPYNQSFSVFLFPNLTLNLDPLVRCETWSLAAELFLSHRGSLCLCMCLLIHWKNGFLCVKVAWSSVVLCGCCSLMPCGNGPVAFSWEAWKTSLMTFQTGLVWILQYYPLASRKIWTPQNYFHLKLCLYLRFFLFYRTNIAFIILIN